MPQPKYFEAAFRIFLAAARANLRDVNRERGGIFRRIVVFAFFGRFVMRHDEIIVGFFGREGDATISIRGALVARIKAALERGAARNKRDFGFRQWFAFEIQTHSHRRIRPHRRDGIDVGHQLIPARGPDGAQSRGF